MEKERQIEILERLKKELEEINNNPNLESSEELQERKRLLEEEIKMRCCNHQFIIGKRIKCYDGHRTDKYQYHYCIKCGLNELFVDHEERIFNDKEEDMMEQVYFDTYNNGEKHDDIYCLFTLAYCIYIDIKTKHPNITDKELIVLFRKEMDKLIYDETIDEKDSGYTKMLKRNFINNKTGYGY